MRNGQPWQLGPAGANRVVLGAYKPLAGQDMLPRRPGGAARSDSGGFDLMVQRRQRVLSRRRFLKRVALAGGAGIAAGGLYAAAIEPTWVQVVALPLPLRGLHEAFTGYRLVQISDMHASATVPLEYLARCMRRVNELEPDLVVFTGDAITTGHVAYLDRAAELLGSLHPVDGVVAVLGNHDYGVHRSSGRAAGGLGERTAAALRAAGAVVLRNASLTLRRGAGRLTIVGLDDLWSGRFDADRAFSGVSRDVPTLVLVHNPDALVRLQDTPAEWVLSGHTHGGQVRLAWLGAPILPVRNRRFAAGHVVAGSRNLYVNRGLGWLLRVRLNCRPEITFFELVRA